jgi:hypothetical protein
VAPLPQITLVVRQFVLEGSSVPSKNSPPGKVPSLSVWRHSNLQKFQPTLGVPMPSADTSMFAIQMIIDLINAHQEDGAVAFLDQEKAFD